jgi:hypothetical protein
VHAVDCSNREQASVDKLSGVPYRDGHRDEIYDALRPYCLSHRACDADLQRAARDGCGVRADSYGQVSESPPSP